MSDQDKSAEQLLAELTELRQRVAKLTDQLAHAKQTEASLCKSEYLYRVILDNLPDPIWVESLDGRIEAVNKAWRAFAESTPDETLGPANGESVPPETVARFREPEIAGAAARRPHSREETVRDAQGNLRTLATFKVELLDSTGRVTGVLGMARDITESKRTEDALRTTRDRLEQRVAERTAELTKINEQLQAEVQQRREAEEAIRESEWKYRVVAENTYDWEFWTDPQGRFIYCSPSCQQVTGHAPDEFIADPTLLEQIIHPEDRGRYFGHFDSYNEGFMPGEIRFRIIRPDGTQRWIGHVCQAVRGDNGAFMGRRGSNRDITQEQQAEAALRELNDNLERTVASRTAELRSITDAAHDAILMMDPHGAISYWNRAAERIFGYTAEEALGRNLHELLAPERFQADHRAAFPEFVRSGNGPAIGKTLELHARHRDGREIAVSLSLSSVSLHGKWHAVGILSDITERKQKDDDLRAAMKVADAANVAKGEFLANMSHEIRTPMNGVIGMTGLLLDTELNASQRRYAEAIRSSGESLLALVNDILDFSKIEAGKLELELLDFNLHDLLESFAAPLAMRARSKGIEFNCALEPNVPSLVRGAPGRLRQVLTNLAGNAVKFTAQGRVSVRVSLVSETAAASVIRFSVQDTGIGIPREQQEMLFEKFSQADTSTTRRHGGTGLGLAISKRLTELMAGEIGVNSQAGAGSEFWFTVPMGKIAPPKSLTQGSAKPAAPASPAGVAFPAVRRQGARILVAEDNVVNQEVALGILHKLGLRAEAVADGGEVIEVLRNMPYELVLMDVQMPEMDGLEATRIIRDPQSPVLDHQIPIVAMTAHAMLGDREHCLQAGMNDYLAKPIDPRALIEALNKWLPPEDPMP